MGKEDSRTVIPATIENLEDKDIFEFFQMFKMIYESDEYEDDWIGAKTAAYEAYPDVGYLSRWRFKRRKKGIDSSHPEYTRHDTLGDELTAKFSRYSQKVKDKGNGNGKKELGPGTSTRSRGASIRHLVESWFSENDVLYPKVAQHFAECSPQVINHYKRELEEQGWEFDIDQGGDMSTWTVVSRPKKEEEVSKEDMKQLETLTDTMLKMNAMQKQLEQQMVELQKRMGIG